MDKNNECIHCGEDCGKSPIVWENKKFCCEGCKIVYQLLLDSKLTSYYEINQSPGIKIEKPNSGNKFNYLDNLDIAKKIIYFQDGGFAKVKLYIPSIHCSSCIWLLENLYRLNPNITQSSVNFIKKEVDITYKYDDISLRQLVELLASIHYIPIINLKSVSEQQNKYENKSLLLKIGIAGFVFGNTMLLSLPDYIPGGELLEKNFKNFFGYLNLLFSLPVLFYSANDYFLSAYKNIKQGFVNIDLPISIGIITIFLESSFQILTSSGTGYMDSLSGLVFFLLLGKWYQSKSYQALSFERDYQSYFPIAVTKITDNKEVIIQLNEIKIGDKIIVHNEELIPADGILKEGEATINYSFVTGEMTPVRKQKGDEIYAGGRQIGSTITIEVEKEVMQSHLTQLWNQEKETEKRNNLSSLIDKISKRFTFSILFIACVSTIFWLFINPNLALKAFTSVLIVACPCALALSIPFTYGNIMRIFGRIGFYLKKAEVVEKLSHINTIVFDKTGTITHIDALSVEYNGNSLNNKQLQLVKSLTRQSKHPLSKAIYDSLTVEIVENIKKFNEIPSQGITATFDDIEVKMGSAKFVGYNLSTNTNSSVVYLSIAGEIFGYFSIENKYRKGIQELAKALKTNFDIHIISGDNDAEESRLRSIFGEKTIICFNQSPMDKYNYIKNLREKGKNVLMVGDGLNDAGALTQSNVGISIADDVFSFSPASDAILEANKFYLLPKLIQYSKKGIKVVYISFIISFLYNIIGISYAISGNLSPIIAAILMPVSSVTVVAFVTLTTNFLMRKLK